MLIALVVLCFTLSGFAALVYQVSWVRLFSIAFGTSEMAVPIVLAGYMAGLAIGAAIVARYISRIRRPLIVYGVLEGAIALSALTLPYLVNLTGTLYVWSVGGQPMPPGASSLEQPVFYSVAAFLVLLIPTALMGATLPLLARCLVTTDRDLGQRISLLYSMNTLGAVGGTLAAGFVLLPALGLMGTVWVGALVNATIFGLAIWIGRLTGDTRSAAENNSSETAAPMSGVSFVLPLIALSGVLSFIYEVLWTRMLSHVLGSSIYAFSTMLAAFLTGIALGAAGAGTVATNPRRGALLFALSQFGIAITAACTYWWMQVTVPSANFGIWQSFIVILPSSFFIGATFPLAVRARAGAAADAGRASAEVYSWNTVGAVIGAVAGGFYIIPAFGFSGTAELAVAGNLLIGIVAIGMATRVQAWPTIRPRIIAAGVLVAAATVFLFNPERPEGLVSQPLFGGSGREVVKEHYYGVGRSSTVYLTENSSRFDLSTNGLPEAQIDFKGAPPNMLSQRWLGLWPSIARASTESMLVVGLGGGVVLESIPKNVRTIHVVELEQEVVNAMSAIGDRRKVDPLIDPRVKLVINDARNALKLTKRQYDAIVSQPSHPWTAGASHLFTQEFFSLVKSRLNSGGIFVQWMNADFLDESLLKRMAATLLSEFAYVRIYQPSSLALHFVASNEPLGLEVETTLAGQSLENLPTLLSRNGISGSVDIVATLLLDEAGVRGFAAGAELITDDKNGMAFDTNVHAQGLSSDELGDITAEFDPLPNPESTSRRLLSDNDIVSIAWRLARQGQIDRVSKLMESVDRKSTRQILQAIQGRFEGGDVEYASMLENIGPASPVYQEAVMIRLLDIMPQIASGESNPSELLNLDLDERQLGVVLAGWKFLAEQQWSSIQALDSRLMDTKIVDLWAPYSAQLMAEWRLHESDPDGRLAAEALEIVSDALAIHPTIDGFLIRARAALRLGDTVIFTESVAQFAAAVRQRVDDLERFGEPLSESEFRSLTKRLIFLADDLERISDSDLTGRAAVVLSDLETLRSSMQR